MTAEEIFDQLTLNEKISLLSGKSMWTLRDIPRVNLPSIQVSDGPQGVRKAVTETTALEAFPATCFPTACAMACSWNVRLMESVGVALSKECRQQGVHILLGPGMNIRRHPCGGRNFEYFSEDPMVSGHMAAAMVHGIQASGHVGACIKHVCVNNQESWRFRVNALVDERTLREMYLSGFEHVVKQAQPWSMMCAYNQLNGVYCSENEWLFQKVIRDEWGYQGHVLTDWGATNQRAAGIQAGIDLEMPGSYNLHNANVKDALKDGSLSQDRFDQAVLRNIRLIRKASMAMIMEGDDKEEHKLPSRPEDLYEQNHELAHQAAVECMVLLQNEDHILPLPPKQSTTATTTAAAATADDSQKPMSLALIGDFCRGPRYQGMGSSKVNATKVDTLLEHIGKYTDNFVFSRGYCNADDDDDDGKSRSRRAKDDTKRKELLEQAVEVAKSADVVVILAGVPEILESEGFDREHLDLPAQHVALIEQISDVNPNVVVVLSNGGPVVMPWKHKVKAIMEGYLLGQAGAKAMLDVLFGIATPSGKLTETFPLSLTDVPSNSYFPGNSHTVEYREGLNIGYRYYDTVKIPVLFPFGHGLSYTSFSYCDCECKLVTDTSLDSNNEDAPLVRVKCTVTNEGSRPGSEIVQVYVHNSSNPSDLNVYHPEHQLKGFAKTQVLPPGQAEQVEFHLTANDFAMFDIGLAEWILEDGARYEIRVAASSRDIRWTGSISSSDIASAGMSSKIKITRPSEEALSSHPAVTRGRSTMSHPLVVSDASFRAMLDQDPHELMHLSSRSLLGHTPEGSSIQLARRSSIITTDRGDLEVPLLPYDIDMLHRNSFLSEIEQNGCFGKLFTKIIIKAMENEMEDPKDKRQKKMIREVANNLPLRCLASFSRGNMNFHLLDSLIAFFNGQYGGAVTHIFSGAHNLAKSILIPRR